MTTESEAVEAMAVSEVAFLVVLAEAGISPDIGELLMQGNPTRGVAPGALRKAMLAYNAALSENVTEAMVRSGKATFMCAHPSQDIAGVLPSAFRAMLAEAGK
jgi:hypothetical protein